MKMSDVEINLDGGFIYNVTGVFKLGKHSIHLNHPVLTTIVNITAKSLLSLCEVEIFQCADGWFSEFCDKQCNCLYTGDVCNKITGECKYGCARGLHGNDCQTPCDAGYHGYNCSYLCGHCVNNECNKETGECDTEGCLSLWDGYACDYCIASMYGPDCTLRCGHCSHDNYCDDDLGYCFGGCSLGYTGDMCLKECSAKTYGKNCGETCGNCSDNETCEAVNGLCINGCKDGFTAPFCKKSVSFWSSSTLVILITSLSVIAAITIFVFYSRRKIQKAKTGSENIGYEDYPTDLDNFQEGEEYQEEKTDIEISQFYNYITKRMSIDEFIHEYRLLPSGLHSAHLMACMKINNLRNRFMSIYPYDHSRVKLSFKCDSSTDYINASYIDGYYKRQNYIATQGPMPTTIEDFWRMVWQENCTKIVMLTNLVENSKIKCEQYWPCETDTKLTMKNLELTLEKTTRRTDYIIRIFTIVNIKTKKERKITHFQYTTWPDHGVSSAPALINFWKVTKSVASELDGPMIVHCSAGVGRTGTFLALDSLIDESKENSTLDIFKYVSIMRADRVQMVQTRNQYIFLHYVVHEAILSQKSLIILDELERQPKDNLLVSESVMEQEFKNITLLKKRLSTVKTKAALESINFPKNRSRSIIPHDDCRVFLVTPVENRNDYIMAYLVPSLYSRDGFISTQLPMESTVVDFWRMVYEYNSLTIVSLVQQTSHDDEISVPYWPATDADLKLGPFIIRNKQNISEHEFYSYSVLEVEKTDVPDPSIKSTIHMYHVRSWPTHCVVPEKKGLLDLIGSIQTRQQEEGLHTIIVQDIDGSTKANMFCGVVNCLSRLKEERVLDVFLTVRYIQTIQPYCFHTLKEYMFCYEMAKEYIDAMSMYRNV